MSRQKGIVDELRRAIAQAEKRGLTRYRIAKNTGLTQALLSRFVAGLHKPRLDVAERIAAGIGLRLILKK